MTAIAIATTSNYAIARPCFPSDPTGSNPGNLCPDYPPLDLNPHTTNFTPGFATEGYYGNPISPNFLLGIPLNPSKPRDGFFTNINTDGNTTTIKTNTGREWKFQAN